MPGTGCSACSGPIWDSRRRQALGRSFRGRRAWGRRSAPPRSGPFAGIPYPASEGHQEPGFALAQACPAEEFAPFGKAGLGLRRSQKADRQHRLPKRQHRPFGLPGRRPRRKRRCRRVAGQQDFIASHHRRLGQVQRRLGRRSRDPHLTLAEGTLGKSEAGRFVPEDHRGPAAGAGSRDLFGQLPGGEMADAISPASAQAGDEPAIGQGGGQIGKHPGRLQHVFGLPGGPKGSHGAPVPRLHQPQARETGVADHPGDRPDVLGTLGADENEVNRGHGQRRIVGRSVPWPTNVPTTT